MTAVTILPPEYWAERVADRDLFELDDNQRLHAERIAQRLMFLDPDADATEIVTYAVKEALQNIPTTREAVKAIAAMRKGNVYCYLAFHGLNGVAEFLKIGMTNHPERRIYGMATGNPLDCLWVFAGALPSRRAAYHVEQTLLRHMSEYRRRGEWIAVDNIGAELAASMARQLGMMAKEAEAAFSEFSLLRYTDGRAAA